MFETVRNAFKIKDLRKKLFYTFFALIVVRIGSQLPVPGVKYEAIREMFNSQKSLDFFNQLTGGSFEQMSIFALNITPYITASIIIQLLTIAIPRLEELHKDGEEGRKKLTEYTRYVTIGLSVLESAAMAIGFGNSGYLTDDKITFTSVSVIIVSLTAGSAFLMWLGEQITEKGVGNGISIVLTINIISGMPSDIANLFKNFVFKEGMSIGGRLLSACVILGVIVGIIVLVVILQGAIRKIAVQMSQKVQGRRQVGGQQSNIPLKVNTAGVIPIIFASSLLQFPVVIASFFGKSPEWSHYLSQSHWCNPSNLKYSIGFVVYLLLVIFFAYFYTSITFNPREVAKNLNDRGGFIPGIRSGKPTVEYLTNILNYIILIGAIGLIIVAAIPILASGIFGAQVGFGGTSIIIIVGVILETLETIKSMVTEKNYSTIKGIF